MPSEFDGVNFPDVPENLKDEGKIKEFLQDNTGGLNYLLRRLKYFYNTVKDFMNNAVTTFLNLTDTPSDYTGNAGKYTRVKSSEDGLEFTDEVVETTGDQTIGGVKTFSTIPVLPASDPTSDNEAVRKKYVDDNQVDEKVKADSGDSTAGYLDAKVDNATIEVDTSNHQLRVKDGGITRVKLVNHTAGDYLVAEADKEKSTSNTSYTKMKEIVIARKGSLRIKFDMKGSGVTVYGRIYKNGSPIGTERSTYGVSYTTYSEDISNWDIGDLCQLYTRTGNVSYPAYIRNFRVYSGEPIVEVVTLD